MIDSRQVRPMPSAEIPYSPEHGEDMFRHLNEAGSVFDLIQTALPHIGRFDRKHWRDTHAYIGASAFTEPQEEGMEGTHAIVYLGAYRYWRSNGMLAKEGLAIPVGHRVLGISGWFKPVTDLDEKFTNLAQATNAMAAMLERLEH